MVLLIRLAIDAKSRTAERANYDHLYGGKRRSAASVMSIAMATMKRSPSRKVPSAESVRGLIDAIPQIVWTNNIDGSTNYFNRRWYEYTGLSYEQPAEPSWQAVIHPDDASVSKERWQGAVKTGEVFECEYRLRNAAGKYRWFIVRTVPLRDDNRIIGWLGSATDIHDLKQAERGGGKAKSAIG